MRRGSGRLARLPEAIRTRINEQIREGCSFGAITDWLFRQTAPQDIVDLNLTAGEPLSLAWTRGTRDERMARIVCEHALGYWSRSAYPKWLAGEIESDKRIRLVERVEQLSQAASKEGRDGATEGGNLIIRSLLMEAITEVCKGGGEPADIARLANAWARTNQAGTEFAKLKLRTQDSTDVGLQALYEDVKDNPEALALFNQFRDVVKASTPENS